MGGGTTDTRIELKEAISHNHPRNPCYPWFVLSLFCFILATLSKPSVVMLPFVLALCIWWMRRLCQPAFAQGYGESRGYGGQGGNPMARCVGAGPVCPGFSARERVDNLGTEISRTRCWYRLGTDFAGTSHHRGSSDLVLSRQTALASSADLHLSALGDSSYAATRVAAATRSVDFASAYLECGPADAGSPLSKAQTCPRTPKRLGVARYSLPPHTMWSRCFQSLDFLACISSATRL